MRHMKCAKKHSDFYNAYNEDGEFRLAVFLIFCKHILNESQINRNYIRPIVNTAESNWRNFAECGKIGEKKFANRCFKSKGADCVY